MRIELPFWYGTEESYLLNTDNIGKLYVTDIVFSIYDNLTTIKYENEKGDKYSIENIDTYKECKSITDLFIMVVNDYGKHIDKKVELLKNN